MKLSALVGSGDRIGLFVLPFLLAGAALNVAEPSALGVGGPPTALRVVSLVILVPGIAIWLWSVALILARVPRGELITSGPFAVVKHPLYTSVAFLVLPWAGFLLDTWLGAAIGIVLYVGSRLFSPREEAHLSATFGPVWNDYCDAVKIPWL
jgi:protein-S-isoprenylcysteine O-methyltransferase Ste14